MTTTKEKSFLFRKSVLIAFHRLLQAAQEGSDVFLLDSRDCLADVAMNEYKDEIRGTDPASGLPSAEYVKFVEWLAKRFSSVAESGMVGSLAPVTKAELLEADQTLAELLAG